MEGAPAMGGVGSVMAAVADAALFKSLMFWKVRRGSKTLLLGVLQDFLFIYQTVSLLPHTGRSQFVGTATCLRWPVLRWPAGSCALGVRGTPVALCARWFALASVGM
jgi:hypothetical protein